MIFLNLLLVSFYSSICDAIKSNENETELKEQANIEGKIIGNLNELSSNDISNLNHAMVINRFKWPGANIYFKIDEEYEDDEVIKIIKTMKSIEKISCVRFKDYDPNYAGDFVYIYKGIGCKSFVGRKGGQQILTLGKKCLKVRHIKHEILHLIGFYHHHNRSDRDQFIDVLFDNIKNGKKFNFEKFNNQNGTFKYLVPFDSKSIMNYGSFTFTSNGKPTIKVKNTNFSFLKSQTNLSKNDIIILNRLYECTSTSKQRPSFINSEFNSKDKLIKNEIDL